ncbi:MAG TPA: hypothetical protein PKY31_03250, partial [Spirochaetota bacterium]|nr:hypothetical protein [Spirochaetota bacterium]
MTVAGSLCAHPNAALRHFGYLAHYAPSLFAPAKNFSTTNFLAYNGRAHVDSPMALLSMTTHVPRPDHMRTALRLLTHVFFFMKG